MEPILCAQCGRAFDTGDESPDRAASICGGIMGDEYVETWYYCAPCAAYTVEVYHDCFLDEGSAAIRGPLPKAEGDEKVALIAQCPEPWDKNCRCPAHRAYFGDSLT